MLAKKKTKKKTKKKKKKKIPEESLGSEEEPDEVARTEEDDSDSNNSNDGDHHASYEKVRKRLTKKTETKDVSAVSLGLNAAELIKKRRSEDDEEDFEYFEAKREEEATILKTAELKEQLRTGPWILVIHIQNALGLRNADVVGKSDPFCQVTLNGRNVGKTKVVNNNLNPIWNWSTHIELDSETLGNSWARTEILVECFDHDLIGKNDFLGRVLLHGEDLLRTLGLSGDPNNANRELVLYPFRDPPKGVRKKSRRATGDLNMSLSLTYHAPPEKLRGDIKLRVFIDRAEGLMPADSVTGTSDPYVRVFWEHKEFYKTKVKKLTLNPKFHEDFEIVLKEGADMRETQLRLDFYDRDLVGKDEFLGRVKVYAGDMVELIGLSTYILRMEKPGDWQKFRLRKRPRGDEKRKIRGVVYLGLKIEDDWSDIESLVRNKTGDAGSSGEAGLSMLEQTDSPLTSVPEDTDLAGAKTAMKQAQSMGLKDSEEYSALVSLSWVLASGKLAKAQQIERMLLRSARERHSENSLMYASVMDHIGLQRLRASSYDEAFKLMDSALIMRQKLYDYQATATSHDSLGQLEYERGNYLEAERLLNRALANRVKLLGEDNPATARTMRTLGCVYRSLGRPDDSIKLLIRSSEIIKKRYGPESLPMATSLILLARHWRREGKKYKLSCRLCRKVLIIRDKKLGPHHPATAVALGEVAASHRARALASAEYREEGMVVATRYLERSVTIKKRLYGAKSLRLAKTLSNLGYLYRELGKHELSMDNFATVYSLCKDRLGPEHPRTILALSSKAAAMANFSFVCEKEEKKEEDADSEDTSSDSEDDASESSNRKKIEKKPSRNGRAIGKKRKKREKKRKKRKKIGEVKAIDPAADRALAKKLLLKALNMSIDKLGKEHPITAKCFRNYVFTKTEQDIVKNRFHLDREANVEEEALGNYLYPWEVCVKSMRKAIWSCATCAFQKRQNQPTESTKTTSSSRGSIRQSRSGSFFSRLVRKGRIQYLNALAEEKQQGNQNNENPVSESQYITAHPKDEKKNGDGISNDPLNLAESYSKLIVQHMDFRTDPNQTQKERPSGWASGMKNADDTNPADHQTELEKAKEEEEIAADKKAVSDLMSSMNANSSALWQDNQSDAGGTAVASSRSHQSEKSSQDRSESNSIAIDSARSVATSSSNDGEVGENSTDEED